MSDEKLTAEDIAEELEARQFDGYTFERMFDRDRYCLDAPFRAWIQAKYHTDVTITAVIADECALPVTATEQADDDGARLTEAKADGYGAMD